MKACTCGQGGLCDCASIAGKPTKRVQPRLTPEDMFPVDGATTNGHGHISDVDVDAGHIVTDSNEQVLGILPEGGEAQSH